MLGKHCGGKRWRQKRRFFFIYRNGYTPNEGRKAYHYDNGNECDGLINNDSKEVFCSMCGNSVDNVC